jgi:hypothetical protein
MILRFLLVLILIYGTVAAAVTWVILRPGPLSATLLVLCSMASFLLIAMAAFHMMWRPMLAPFPPREPALDAVRRRFQSMGLGIVNMGLSIHIAVDQDYLHMTPLRIWRLLGATPASIPWSAMEPVGRSGRVVRINGRRLDGPKWCMTLAAPPDPS